VSAGEAGASPAVASLRAGVRARGWAFGVALVAAAALVGYLAVEDRAQPLEDGRLPWWVFAIAFLLAEAYVVKAEWRPEIAALSPHDAGLGLGLFLLAPAGLLGAQLLGAAAALALLRTPGTWRVMVRLATLVLSSSVAILLFGALERMGDASWVGWGAAFAAVLTGSLAMALVSAAAAHVTGRRWAAEDVGRALALVAAGAIASSSIAIAAVELVRAGEKAALFLVVPFVSCAIVLRMYASERRRLGHLRALYNSMTAAQRSPGVDEGMREMLEAARRLLHADLAWIGLLPKTPSGRTLVAWADERGVSPMAGRTLTPVQRAALEAATRSDGGLLVSPGRPPGLEGMFRELGLRRGMLAPLRGETGVIGVLLVGDRDDDRGTFTAEHLRVLEAYAGHASVLIENDRLERSLEEVTALKEQLRHQAYHDALTGLPNRVLFAEHVMRATSRQDPGLATPAVLFLDLDDYKTINDSLGHEAGDELLVAVAGRVRNAVRTCDLPARLGGDEFAVLAPAAGMEDAERIAGRLVRALDEPFVICGREISVHASIGIAFAEPGASADELLRSADVAMYSAKQNGKRRFVVYEPQMHARVRHRQELVTALERAVERGEIDVHYQPIVELGSNHLVAVEALARWTRPGYGLLGPSTFLPVADEMGMMVEIGRLVLRQACRQAVSWQRNFPGRNGLCVNVNLAPSELHDPDLIREVESVLEQTGLDPSLLVLELTESGVMRSPDQARRTMASLRSLGVALALDDFGTGHSSLAHLREFPLDELKIAQAFVAGLPQGHVDAVFIETIVRLAQSLGLTAVAEGIESHDQAVAVQSLGCTHGQGFYFGEPLGAIGVATYLGASALPAVPAVVQVA
jgi:diguanylate cyclase (GGDEF)-like protein